MCEGQGCSETPSLVEREASFEALMVFLDENHDAIASMIQSTTETAFFCELPNSCDESKAYSQKPCPTHAAQPPRTRSAIHSGKRRRQELTALRAEVAQLEEQLKRLKTQLDEETSSTSTLGWLHTETWQAVTLAQQQRRKAAEKERERLRELVRERVVVAQGIYPYVCGHVPNDDVSV